MTIPGAMITTTRRVGALGSPISNGRSGIERKCWRRCRSGWRVVRTEFLRMVAYDLEDGKPVFARNWSADK